MVGRWEGGRQWRKKNLRLKGNLKQINFGNQEFPVRKKKQVLCRSPPPPPGHLPITRDGFSTTLLTQCPRPLPSLTPGKARRQRERDWLCPHQMVPF